MKLRLLLICFSIGGSLYSSAQENSKSKLVRTESNGVQVFEAQGNEVPALNANSQEITVGRTISDWDLEECDNSLYFIQLKIESLKEQSNSALEIEKLQEMVIQINSHKSYLLSKN